MHYDYLSYAAERKISDADDRRLAGDAQCFVAEMREALTRQKALAMESRQVLESGKWGGKG